MTGKLDLYDESFYASLIRDDWEAQQKAVAGCVACFGAPHLMIDVGCGAGATVHYTSGIGYESNLAALSRALKAAEIDHAWTPPEHLWFYKGGWIMEMDLRRAIPAADRQTADLVISWEVGEHIEERFAPAYVGNVARCVAPGGVLVFTAAQPGQQGQGHVNCQPKEYWRDLFAVEGLAWDGQWSEWLAVVWDHTIANPLAWLRDNVQVFRRPA